MRTMPGDIYENEASQTNYSKKLIEAKEDPTPNTKKKTSAKKDTTF